MLTKEIILSYLREHKAEIAHDYKILTIGLCGSYARNEQRDDSDIDFVVEMSEADFFLRMKLAEHLSQVFGKEVQVLSRAALRTFVWRCIQEDIRYV
jgi:predicted nucleotidyltransferase